MTTQTKTVMGAELQLLRKVRPSQHSWWRVGTIEVKDLKINNRLYSGTVALETRYGKSQSHFDCWELVNTEGNKITENARVKLSRALQDAFEVVPPTHDEMRACALDAVKNQARYAASRILYEARRELWSNDMFKGLVTDKEAEKLAYDAAVEYLDGEVTL